MNRERGIMKENLRKGMNERETLWRVMERNFSEQKQVMPSSEEAISLYRRNWGTVYSGWTVKSVLLYCDNSKVCPKSTLYTV